MVGDRFRTRAVPHSSTRTCWMPDSPAIGPAGPQLEADRDVQPQAAPNAVESDAVITADQDTRITGFDGAAERLFGYRCEDVIGKRLVDVIVPPALRAGYGDGFARRLFRESALVLGKPASMQAMRADESEFLAELTIASRVADARAGIVIRLRDLSGRRGVYTEPQRDLPGDPAGPGAQPTGGVWAWNPDSDDAFASAEARRIFGVSPRAAVGLAHVLARIHPDDRAHARAALEQAHRDSTPFDFGVRVMHEDGAFRHIRVTGGPMPSLSPRAGDFVAAIFDVTEWFAAREAQFGHGRAVALRADVSDALARADGMRNMLQKCAEALVRHVDAAFARIWTLRRGSSVLELEASAGLHTQLDGSYARVRVGELKIGRIALERAPYLVNDVFTDARIDDKAWARREGIVAFAGYPLIVEDRVVGVMAMFSKHKLEANTLETLASIATAIAQGIERKRSEEALQRSEMYLVEGQRLTHTGSWAWKRESGERFWSPEMFRVLGFEPADAPPPYELSARRAHPLDRAKLERRVEESFRSGREFRLLTRILIENKPIRWLETHARPIVDSSGSVVEIVGTVVDITDRLRAHRRLRRAIKARYQAVLAERLRIAREMHDGLLQDITGVALQLRALLPHIRSAPDIAIETLARTLELTERAGREARKAVIGIRTTEDAGDFARAVENAALRAASRGSVTVSVDVAGPARAVSAEISAAAAAIVHEAVANVVKHTDARTAELSIVFRKRTLRVSVRDDGRPVARGDEERDGHFGLIGMRERAANVGASLSIRRSPHGGTVVLLGVPYR